MEDKFSIELNEEEKLNIALNDEESLNIKLENDFIKEIEVTNDYEKQINLPKINNIELKGNRDLPEEELSILELDNLLN